MGLHIVCLDQLEAVDKAMGVKKKNHGWRYG